MMRRGLTFLETLLASVILALMAAAALGAINFISSRQIFEQRQLSCVELANRLMVIYIDDDAEIDKMEKVIEYGRERYRWSAATSNVVLTPAKEDANARANARLDRFQNVRINVWLSDESGGGYEPGPGVPQATIVRLVDPIPLQNPDSLQNAAKGGKIVEKLLRGGGAPGTRGTSGTKGDAGTSGGGTGAGGKSGSGSTGGGKSK